jgi:predicted enzyme related to lactoylglutathione lyase
MNGNFVWYELVSDDVAAATSFYAHVIGWAHEVTDIAGPPYTLFKLGEAAVAGLIGMQDVPPFWLGYVGVEDVDAASARAEALGATIDMPPRDLPNVGRFAVVRDPQGAPLALFRWLEPGTPAAHAPGTPGTVGWHELTVPDWEAVYPFYEAMFGWRKSTAMDMGPAGVYQLFTADGPDIGGMMSQPGAPPSWLYYFNVSDIDEAMARVHAQGGTVFNGPMQVPTGQWIAQCRDPQNAVFALVGGRQIAPGEGR